jgi:4-hydroxy-tetrahydrodipicolinate reductase
VRRRRGGGRPRAHGPADPALGTELAGVLADADVVVEFTRPRPGRSPRTRLPEAGVHVVVGTTGFDLDALRAQWPRVAANAFFAPNFAIGAC